MAENFDVARLSDDKRTRYAELAQEVAAVLEGETNLVARMSTVASMLHHAFDTYYWTGFYLVDRERSSELVVGPYQGTLGCLRIPFGRGVCGAAARDLRTVVVEDVSAFEGHIACDARSRSEVVTPVFGPSGELIAVFDVDSDNVAAFDQVDAQGIEAILIASFGSRAGSRAGRSRAGGHRQP